MEAQLVVDMEVQEIPLPPTVEELIYDDGEPVESEWHRAQINLFIESLRHHWKDRQDFYAGGNMFVYYSMDQVRQKTYRGPDFFVVLDVDGSYQRKAWVVWEEGARFPNVIVELLSKTTAKADLGAKKNLYASVFHTSDYYCYDPNNGQFFGWTLDTESQYQTLPFNDQGWVWCKRLGLWIGPWEGRYLEQQAVWLRFFDIQGNLVLTKAEAEEQRAEAEAQRAEAEAQRAEAEAQRAEAEAQRAEAERARAEKAEADNERLRARLLALGLDPNQE